jgi:hypothetical protein
LARQDIFFAHKEKQRWTIYTQHNSSDRREDLRATAAAAAATAIADALRSKSLWEKTLKTYEPDR